ncbi:GYF domain-containing protein [Strongyloides ratti]|uniref:GYF domain-containing protein n=1 Tax=Strongyloides ratti TaxID=34506 RepID=A0A090LNA2_STRRB|nr:GYF domain-containing protein [Strongyloides ratti]CEF69654.1 GYF domain-containing protein [Strongyloides ratti]
MTITNNRTEMASSPEAITTPNPSEDGRKKWYYCGNDQVIYGPYTSNDMRVWTENGYIGEYVMIRGEDDLHFHRLMDYRRALNGDCPFKCDISSFESIQQPNHNNQNFNNHDILPSGDGFDYNERLNNVVFISHTGGSPFYHPTIPPHMISYNPIPVISPQLTNPLRMINNPSSYGMEINNIQGNTMENTINYSPTSSENFDETNNNMSLTLDASTSTSDAPWIDCGKIKNVPVTVDISTSTDDLKKSYSDVGTQTTTEINAKTLTELFENMLESIIIF